MPTKNNIQDLLANSTYETRELHGMEESVTELLSIIGDFGDFTKEVKPEGFHIEGTVSWEEQGEDFRYKLVAYNLEAGSYKESNIFTGIYPLGVEALARVLYHAIGNSYVEKDGLLCLQISLHGGSALIEIHTI